MVARVRLFQRLLTQRMVDLNVHRTMENVEQFGGVLAPVLVALRDRLGFPVGEVQIIFEHR